MSKPGRFEFGHQAKRTDTTIRPSDYRARLDKKTRQKVLYGYRTCRGQLGTVTELRHVAGAWVRRELVMPPGWQQDDHGVWRLTAWAQKRHDADLRQDPRLRGRALREPRFRRGYVRNATIRTQRELGEPEDVAPQQLGIPVAQFPVIAICPVCGHRNILEADRLEVRTEDDEWRELEESARRLLDDPDRRGWAERILAQAAVRKQGQSPAEGQAGTATPPRN